MGFSKAWLAAPALVVLLSIAGALGGGCSSTNGGGGSSGSGSGGSSSGPGICLSACDKPCGSDSDCDTSNGELCCDYGSAGKVCQSAKSCPKFCGSDTDCLTSMGQACEKVSLSSPVTVCEPASSGLKTCTVDTDCPGSSEVCCNIYSKGLCTPANECPKSCSDSSSCNTQNGEVCCTTVKAVDPSITAAGLCLNPQYAPCPKACPNGDSDCASTNQLCCNGICSNSCPKSCTQSSDCDQQICCTSYKASLPPGPTLFHTGPTCTGTPLYTTCQQCQSRGCSCPGCGTEAGTGYCQGTPYATDCTYCGQNYSCNCVGCTLGASACTGNPTYQCNQWDGDQTGCLSEPGCTYPDGGTLCTGTPTACASLISQQACQTQTGCTWGASCTGTVTQCSQLTSSTTCAQQQGCNYYTGTSACDGTLTPCDQIPATQCSLQPGCVLTQ